MKLVLHKEHRQTAVIEKGDLRTWLWHQFDEYHHGITVHFKDGHEIDLGPYSFDEAKEVEQQLLELVGDEATYIADSKLPPTPEENMFDIFYEFTAKLQPMLKDLNLPSNIIFSVPDYTFDLLVALAEMRVSLQTTSSPFSNQRRVFCKLNGFRIERR